MLSVVRAAWNTEKSDSDRIWKKYAPRKEEPFRVVAVDSKTIAVMRDGLEKRVSEDGVVKAAFMVTSNRTSLTAVKIIPDKNRTQIWQYFCPESGLY